MNESSDPLEEVVPRVYRFALRLTNDRHLAEDLTQETMLRAWRHRRDLRESKALRTWLFQIAANLWRDEMRRKRRQRAAPPATDSATEQNCSPEATASEQETRSQALAAMNALPQRQREVLYLSAVEKLSLDEIAETLGITKSAAKGSLCVARKRMRLLLREHIEG